MAQQPAKLRWKEHCWYGLSASQFGMALGFSGRISDFIDYLRNIVGTEHEFKGNSFTNHGIVTEPKARALYEVLTGSQVHDGGFFLAHGRLLGCSPDGQVFYHEDTVLRSSASSPLSPQLGSNAPWLASRATPTTPLVDSSAHPQSVAAGLSRFPSSNALSATTQCAVRIPFSKKRSRSSGPRTPVTTCLSGSAAADALATTTTTTTVGPEVTSEVRTRPSAPPTLRQDSEDVLTVRTRRRRLLEIKSPFRALYDCKKKEYQPFGIPLNYMCQMQGQMAIADAEECDFFVYLDQPCQVEAWRVKRSRAFWTWAEPKLLSVVAWTRDGPPDWLDRRFSFEPFDFSSLSVEPLVFPFDISVCESLRDAQRFRFFETYQWPQRRPREPESTSCPAQGDAANATQLSTSLVLLTPSPDAQRTARVVSCDAVRFLFCDAALSQTYSLESLADTFAGSASVDTGPSADDKAKPETVEIEASAPFTMNEEATTCLRQLLLSVESWNTLPTDELPSIGCGVPTSAHQQQQRLLVRLTAPLDWEKAEILVEHVFTHGEPNAHVEEEDNTAALQQQHLLTVRCFQQQFFEGLTRNKVPSTPTTPRASRLAEEELLSPSQAAHDGEDLREALLHRTPVKDAVAAGESLSQHIRLSLSPVKDHTSIPSSTEDPTPPIAEPKVIEEDDLLELIRYANDCSDVWVVGAQNEHDSDITAQHHARPVDVDSEDAGALFTLVVGSGSTLRRLVQHALEPVAPVCPPHRADPSSVTALLTLLRHACLATTTTEVKRTAPKLSVVLCYVEESLALQGDAVFPPLPCFVVNGPSEYYAVREHCLSALSSWS